jgi:tetratricopeptide (TPR) repeat protein
MSTPPERPRRPRDGRAGDTRPDRSPRAGRGREDHGRYERKGPQRGADRPVDTRAHVAPERITGPALPDGATADALDPEVRRDLRSLSPDRAEQAACHLVAAGLLIDDDPQTALAHARTARALGSRLAVVREAVGLAAYAAGEFKEAAAEIRAHRRMSGDPQHLAVLADCERALGRPERALAMLDEPDVGRLDAAARIELLIVGSGARRDLGDATAAVALLEIAELDATTVRPWTPRLWYAYADALLAAGRADEAVRWFAAVAAIDEGETDADERLVELAPSDS